MRNNPDTGFIMGTIEEKVGDLESTDLRSVRIKVKRFEDELEETWRRNNLTQEIVPDKVIDVYLNPRYGGRYDELSVGDHVRVHVALIGAWSAKKGSYNYLIGDRTEILQ